MERKIRNLIIGTLVIVGLLITMVYSVSGTKNMVKITRDTKEIRLSL